MRVSFTLALLFGYCIALVASHSVQNAPAELHRRHHSKAKSHHRVSKKRQNSCSASTRSKAKKPSTSSPAVEAPAASSPSSPAPAAASPASSPSTSSNSGSSSSGTSGSSGSGSKTTSANLAAITGFLNKPNSGIGSWFRADNSGDSTNGHSWCLFPYSDNSQVFAPSYNTMVNNFGGDQNAARAAYCGLEATVTNPANGKTMTLYIGDAFDDTWVRTPDSIDIMTASFNELFGSDTSNKDDVIQGVQWTLTGNRSAQYTVNGPGN